MIFAFVILAMVAATQQSRPMTELRDRDQRLVHQERTSFECPGFSSFLNDTRCEKEFQDPDDRAACNCLAFTQPDVAYMLFGICLRGMKKMFELELNKVSGGLKTAGIAAIASEVLGMFGLAPLLLKIQAVELTHGVITRKEPEYSAFKYSGVSKVNWAIQKTKILQVATLAAGVAIDLAMLPLTLGATFGMATLKAFAWSNLFNLPTFLADTGKELVFKLAPLRIFWRLYEKKCDNVLNFWDSALKSRRAMSAIHGDNDLPESESNFTPLPPKLPHSV